MQTTLGVFNSDRMNRHGMIFPLPALLSALEQRWLTGTPNYLGHDRHRLAGWSHPLGIHIQSGLARLTGVCLLAESQEEQAGLAAHAGRYMQTVTAEHVGPHVGEFERLLAGHLTPGRRWAEASCAAVIDDGLAVRAFPDIFALKDKDGLFPLSALHQVAPGVFRRGDLLLFAHPYFRRSLSRHNTLNEAFLSRLSSLAGDVNPRIALDEDMVGLASTLTRAVELMYEWGPHFNDDLSAIKEGITVHRASDAERVLHGISRTEFWWYGQKGKRTFEAEEIVDVPSGGIGGAAFGCRFVHTILDDERKSPIHFDGAVRQYDDEAMIARLDQTIYQAGRKAGYTKLWRTDGEVGVASWKDLMCHYFRDNRQVGEYLGAAAEEEDGPVLFPSASEPLATFVPYHLAPGDGVQIHVSFGEKQTGPPGRSIRILDVLAGDGELPFVDDDAVELVKALRSRGEALELPASANRVAFGDTVTNLPLVAHAGAGAVALAEATLNAVSEVCNRLLSRREDRLVSFSVAVEYLDKEVLFSFAGHLRDIRGWFASGPVRLPPGVEGVGAWLEGEYSRLNGLFARDRHIHLLHRLLQPTGMLVFVRRFLMPGTFGVFWDEQQAAVMFEVAVPEGSPEREMLESGALQVAPAHHVLKSRCSGCGREYSECPCSKYADGVFQQMEETPCVGAFWTNRKA